MRVLILVLVLALSGCASWNRETIIEEATYQTLHVVDTAQTLNIRKQWERGQNLCEVDSSWAIGREPTPGRVIPYMAAEAVAHAGITNLMVTKRAPQWAIRTWQVVTIGVTVDEIGRNYYLGIRF